MRTEGGDERAVRRGSFGKKMREEVLLKYDAFERLSDDAADSRPTRTFLLEAKKKITFESRS